VLEVTKLQRIAFSYWSSFSDKPDRPENYQTVSYELRSEPGNTVVTVNKSCSEQEREHCEGNWKMVLEGLKKVVRIVRRKKPENSVVDGWSALSDSGFEPLNGAVQAFPVGRGERLKLEADVAYAAPADNGAFNQDRSLIVGKMDEEIHLHPRHGFQATFKPTAFAREIE
jgi:hypothetical protein